MDATALLLLEAFAAEPRRDDRRLVLCDRLEETDDPRHALLRRAEPHSECRAISLDLPGEPDRHFRGPVGSVTVPLPIVFHSYSVGGIRRPGDPEGPLIVSLARPAEGAPIVEDAMHPRAHLVRTFPPHEPGVLCRAGLTLKVRGDGGVTITVPVPRGRYVLAAAVFGTAAAFWRDLLPRLFPEITSR